MQYGFIKPRSGFLDHFKSTTKRFGKIMSIKFDFKVNLIKYDGQGNEKSKFNIRFRIGVR